MAWAGCLLICGVAGCDSGSDRPAPASELQAASYRQIAPDQYLADVLARYRNAAVYHDRGFVRLRRQRGGRWEDHTAPLSVWYAHERLYVTAYDARLWSDAGQLTAWIEVPRRDLAPQLLSQSTSRGRPRLDTLLADPILSERIGAGLAGPPPQLDWLFAAQPMKRLFEDPQVRFDFGEPSVVDGRDCLSIVAASGPERYQFWIDSQSGVIRRIELPPVRDLNDASAGLAHLSLELSDASFERGQTPNFESPPTRSLPVSRLVPLPPEPPADVLGESLPPFRLTADDGSFAITHRGSDREVTMLMWVTNDSRAISSATALARWHAIAPPQLRDRLRIAIVAQPTALADVAEPALPIISSDLGAANLPLPPGGLMVLDKEGRVAWLQDQLTSDTMTALGPVISDILQGVDVPARLRQQWQGDQQLYLQQIDQVKLSERASQRSR